MERIQHLIDKLMQQKNKGESAAQLLITVQLLHQELIGQQQTKLTSGKSKVAVVMPVNNIVREFASPGLMEKSPLLKEEIKTRQSIPEEYKRFLPAETPPVFVQEKKEETKNIPVNQIEKNERPEIYSLPKPVVETKPVVEKTQEPTELFPLHFEEMEDAPTLVQHLRREKEIHEVIAEKKESFNDKLKQEKLELGNTLKEAPIKDLRKGIGVNDKFLFINELFRGDEDMYERSIKTINGFRILPEAEYWMNRELKVKLGWNDSKDTVQHFYGVVRRRFS
jgi:hypothetical protein